MPSLIREAGGSGSKDRAPARQPVGISGDLRRFIAAGAALQEAPPSEEFVRFANTE